MKPITIKADPANPNRMEDADKKRFAEFYKDKRPINA